MNFVKVGIFLTCLDAAVVYLLKHVLVSVELSRFIAICMIGSLGWVLYSYTYKTPLSIRSLIRFWQANGMAMLSNFAIFSALKANEVNVWVAFIIGTISSAFINYLYLKNWVFNSYANPPY